MDHQRVEIGGAARRAVRGRARGDQPFVSVFDFFQSDDLLFRHFGKTSDFVFCQKFPDRPRGEHLAVGNIHDIVRHAHQIGSDMRGKKHGHALFFDDF